MTAFGQRLLNFSAFLSIFRADLGGFNFNWFQV